MAIALYANEYGDAMPPDWVTLMVAEDLVPEVLTCPSSDDERSAATQPADLARDLAAGGHCSYAYLGTGLLKQYTADDVIAFDLVANHGTSINVLFGDGHAESVDGALCTQLLTQYAAGSRSIRLPAKRSPDLMLGR